jgi:hypothetical protein
MKRISELFFGLFLPLLTPLATSAVEVVKSLRLG